MHPPANFLASRHLDLQRRLDIRPNRLRHSLNDERHQQQCGKNILVTTRKVTVVVCFTTLVVL